MRLKGKKSLITKRSIGQIALLVSALATPAPTWAQADASKQMEQADAAQTFRQGRLLDTFGKWQIRKGLVANSYLLIGRSGSDGKRQFWLHCDQHNLMTVAVPLMELSGSDRLRSYKITIRSDTGRERELDLIVFENFVAVAVDYEGGGNNKVADFLDVLRASNQTATISYGDKSFEYDVKGLPAAQARFQELCRRAVR